MTEPTLADDYYQQLTLEAIDRMRQSVRTVIEAQQRLRSAVEAIIPECEGDCCTGTNTIIIGSKKEA